MRGTTARGKGDAGVAGGGGGHGDGKGEGHGDGGEGMGWHGGTWGAPCPSPCRPPTTSTPPPTHPASPSTNTPGPLPAPTVGAGAPRGRHPRDSPPRGTPPRSPHHSLRLCSKDAQLFISSPAGGPAPAAACPPLPFPPPQGAQAARGPPEQMPSPSAGRTPPLESHRRARATILFPFNSACGSGELSTPSPRLGPRAELPGGGGRGGDTLLFPPFPPPPCLHLIAALSGPLSCC